MPGDRVATFSVETTRGAIAVPDPTGRTTLLLFFVEAGTPLCTRQIGAFETDGDLLAEANAVVLALSTDSLERQRTFASAFGRGAVALGADAEGAVARCFGVYDDGERRARRAAFVIAGDGTVLAAEPWYNPANSGQYEALFAALLREPED